ncbi:hypothetical protein MaudCBS49596_004266 [Microsporum audouinii]
MHFSRFAPVFLAGLAAANPLRIIVDSGSQTVIGQEDPNIIGAFKLLPVWDHMRGIYVSPKENQPATLLYENLASRLFWVGDSFEKGGMGSLELNFNGPCLTVTDDKPIAKVVTKAKCTEADRVFKILSVEPKGISMTVELGAKTAGGEDLVLNIGHDKGEVIAYPGTKSIKFDLKFN